GADGNFARSRRGASKQKVCDVRAAYKQEKPDRGEEKKQNRANSANGFFMQRPDTNAGVLIVVGILFLEAAADRVHCAARFRKRDARFQARPNIEITAVVDRTRIDIRPNGTGRDPPETRRDPELAVIVRLETRRHNADDGVRLIVERNLAADDVAVGTVATRP